MARIETAAGAKPWAGTIYNPATALDFFKAAGRPQKVPAGAVFFSENERARSLLFRRDDMYLVLEGEVQLVAGRKPIATIRKGEVFGEMASIAHLPRSASAVAKTACRVIALDDRQFRAGLQKKPGFALMLMSSMITRLRGTLAQLASAEAIGESAAIKESAVFDPKRLAELAEGLSRDEPVFYERGATIVKEGQQGLRMYAVMEGRVAASIRGSVVERLGPGGVFGELALVEPSPRLATVVAETDCTLLPVSRTGFQLIVKTSPEFAESLLEALARRLRRLTSRLK